MSSMKPTLPSISILVMSYNQEAFIGACADSVLSQEYDGELEFIFCDDNSSDSTFKIIEEKVYHYTGSRRVVTHKAEKNGKVATNMNIAVKLAKYDWLMRVDGDDILHPDRTRLTALAISLHPKASAISGQLIPFKNNIVPVENVEDAKLIYHSYNYTDFTDKDKPRNLEWWGCMMCISRRIFTEFGDLPAICNVLDDTMFATRALMLGDFIIIENGILLYYRRHEGNISSAANKCELSIWQYIDADAATRDYYRRGMSAHPHIIEEISHYCETHPEYQTLLKYFENRFAELKRQALFWKKSWSERIADAKIEGPIWRKIPWAMRVMCPFTYALAAKYMKKS